MKINRSASAAWSGGLRDGKGSISTKSGALKEYPYGFASRFEGKPGTNPEELIGAAHAGVAHRVDRRFDPMIGTQRHLDLVACSAKDASRS